jgi:deoxyadenosine/deoxycytidine kinase
VVSFQPSNARRPARPRVEILGIFGSGKTTLAARLAATAGTQLPEDHRLNPFWGRDDAIAIAGGLGYELFFLLQHGRLAAEPWNVGAEALGICDWSFATDRLWASMRLRDELKAYDEVHRELLARVGEPLGYLYLRQPIEKIAVRLTARGREPEAPLIANLSQATEALDALVATVGEHKVLVCDDDLPTERFVATVAGWRGANE